MCVSKSQGAKDVTYPIVVDIGAVAFRTACEASVSFYRLCYSITKE